MTSTFKAGFRTAVDKARNDEFIEVGRASADSFLIVGQSPTYFESAMTIGYMFQE